MTSSPEVTTKVGTKLVTWATADPVPQSPKQSPKYVSTDIRNVKKGPGHPALLPRHLASHLVFQEHKSSQGGWETSRVATNPTRGTGKVSGYHHISSVTKSSGDQDQDAFRPAK